MQLNFIYKCFVPEGEGEIEIDLEIEVKIISGGFDYPGFGGGFKSYPEIDNIEFSQVGLNIEQIKYIENNILDSDALITRIWDEYDRNS